MGTKDYILLAVFYGSLCAGIVFPEASTVMSSSLKYLLMGLLFISFLKISLVDVIKALKNNWKGMIGGTVLRLIIAPALAYMTVNAIYPPLALPALLLGGVATGVSAPFFTSVCRGNISYTLVMAMVTSLLLPFTLPTMVRILSNSTIDYSLTSMALFLAAVIFIPLIAAFVLKHTAPGVIAPFNRNSYALSLIVIAGINFAALGRYVPYLKAHPGQIFYAVLCAVVLAPVMGGLGWFSARNCDFADRIAASGSQVWVNNMLIVALAVQIDLPLAATLGIMYLIPFYVAAVVFAKVADKQSSARPC